MPKYKEPRRKKLLKKSHFDYEAPEERLQDEQERLKVDFVFTVMDGDIAQVKETIHSINAFDWLFNYIKSIDKFDQSELLNKCRTLESVTSSWKIELCTNTAGLARFNRNPKYQ